MGLKNKSNRSFRRRSLVDRLFIGPFRRLGGFLAWALQLPFRLIADFFRFMGQTIALWWKGRDRRSFLWGMPVFLLTSCVVYLVIVNSSYSDDQRYDDYLKAAQSAFTGGKYPQARLLYDRVISIRKDDQESLFHLAIAAGQSGNLERSSVIIAQLAPDERPVYGPAHYERALAILNQKSVHPAIIMMNALPQLLHTVARVPLHQKAHEYLANIYFAQQKIEKSIEHYRLIVENNPSYHLQLAKAYALNGDIEKSRSQANLSEKYHRDKLVQNPQDQAVRISLADCQMFLEKYQTSVQTLLEGLPWGSTPELQSAIARVYIAWSDSLPSKTIKNRRERFSKLSEALNYDIRDLILFDRILNILNWGDALSEEAREILKKNITSGDVPTHAVSLSHLILGTEAGQDGDLKQATFHLTQAQKINASSELVANNLAWYMAVKPDSDLRLALEIIDQTINNSKNIMPHFYDTKGLILYKMGKFESALDQYLLAIQGLKDDADYHERVSMAYEKLNQDELAKVHKEKSNELRNKKSKNSPAKN